MLWCLFFAAAARAAALRFDLYFVAIGSDNYVQPAKANHFSPLQNAADRSGQRVGELLQRAGARFGVTLVSDDNRRPANENNVKRMEWSKSARKSTSDTD